MKKVLVTNGQQRKTLAVVRSLGRKNITVLVSEDTRFNPSAFSKYCTKFIKSPNAKEQPEEYLKWLQKTITENGCEVLFPMDDDTMDIVMSNYFELSKLCTIPVPPLESYLLCQDKGRSSIFVKECGVDCPQTVIVEDISLLEEISKKLIYPVVIKPIHSSGSRGIRLVKDKEELLLKYMEIHSEFPYPIIQEYIGDGDRYDVCLLVGENNEIKSSFMQKELRHFPLKMGPSTVQESIYVEELFEAASKILEKLRWYGVIEIEFMQDSRDGRYKFMEINPRFWGSLYTAIAAGIDFPQLLYKLAVKKDFVKQQDYDLGLKGRWLLPGDLLHFIVNKDRLKMNPPLIAGKKYKVVDDTVSREDPMPTIGFFLACIKYAFNIKMWKFMFRR